MSQEIYYTQGTKHLLFQHLSCSLYFFFLSRKPLCLYCLAKCSYLVAKNRHVNCGNSSWTILLQFLGSTASSARALRSMSFGVFFFLLKQSAFNRFALFQLLWVSEILVALKQLRHPRSWDSYKETSWERHVPRPASEWVWIPQFQKGAILSNGLSVPTLTLATFLVVEPWHDARKIFQCFPALGTCSFLFL